MVCCAPSPIRESLTDSTSFAWYLDLLTPTAMRLPEALFTIFLSKNCWDWQRFSASAQCLKAASAL